MVPTARTALILLLCLVCALTAISSTAVAPGEETYVVTQGDTQIEITPVGDGSQSVEEFYDYRTPETHEYPDYLYSSYGTSEFQQDDTSTLMLYEGTNGLSLVLVHDRVEGDTRGGSATMQIDGLPESGEWVIEDDTYSEGHYGGPLDEFDHDGTSSRITWIWTTGRTDGGAFRGGLDDGDWEIAIEPSFNEAADFRYEDPPGYDGQIEDWAVVSGAGDSHTTRSLPSTEEPITIAPGGVPELSVSSLSASPSTVAPGEPVTISSTVANVGSADGEFDFEFTSDGEVLTTETVSLEAGENTTLTVETTFDSAGSHEVGVEGTTTTVQVAPPASNGTENGGDENGSENGGTENGSEIGGNENGSENGGDENGSENGSSGSDDDLDGFGVTATVLAVAAVLAAGLTRRSV